MLICIIFNWTEKLTNNEHILFLLTLQKYIAHCKVMLVNP